MALINGRVYRTAEITNPRKGFSPSVLRWMGGKYKARKQILPHIPRTGPVVSPFLGGGPIEVCLSSDVSVYASDIDSGLIAYWHCIRDDHMRVRDEVSRHFPVDKAKFRELRAAYKNELSPPFERAAALFLLNRYSMHGKNSHYSVYHHFNGTRNDDPRSIVPPPPSLSVECLDYRDALEKHPDKFAYLDPPYYGVNHYADAPKWRDADHVELAGILRTRETPWLLSYQEHPRIRELYAGHYVLSVVWHYASTGQAGKKSRGTDILIFGPEGRGAQTLLC